jgi:hypothetical protein
MLLKTGSVPLRDKQVLVSELRKTDNLADICEPIV